MPSKVIDLSRKSNKKKANSQAISHLIAGSRDESAPSGAASEPAREGMPLLLDYALYCNGMKLRCC